MATAFSETKRLANKASLLYLSSVAKIKDIFSSLFFIYVYVHALGQHVSLQSSRTVAPPPSKGLGVPQGGKIER